MKNIISLLIFVVVALTACESSEYQFEKSIFIPDPEIEGLPAYTEWGYNTFGALYERQAFIFNETDVPAKIIYTNNKARFVLSGNLATAETNYNGDVYYSYHSPMSLSIDLPDFYPENYLSLIELNGKTFDLTTEGLDVSLDANYDTLNPDIIQGQLQFSKAQLLIIDESEKPQNVILSGYFGLQFLDGKTPVSISHGRFDVSIDEYNFFKY